MGRFAWFGSVADVAELDAILDEGIERGAVEFPPFEEFVATVAVMDIRFDIHDIPLRVGLDADRVEVVGKAVAWPALLEIVDAVVSDGVPGHSSSSGTKTFLPGILSGNDARGKERKPDRLRPGWLSAGRDRRPMSQALN